jgi:invasion protein IalB
VVAHAFNHSTWEAEAGGFLSSRPAWSTECQDSQGYTEKPCLEKTKQNKKNPNKQKSAYTLKRKEKKCQTFDFLVIVEGYPFAMLLRFLSSSLYFYQSASRTEGNSYCESFLWGEGERTVNLFGNSMS